jgi:hypothetical protein
MHKPTSTPKIELIPNLLILGYEFLSLLKTLQKSIFIVPYLVFAAINRSVVLEGIFPYFVFKQIRKCKYESSINYSPFKQISIELKVINWFIIWHILYVSFTLKINFYHDVFFGLAWWKTSREVNITFFKRTLTGTSANRKRHYLKSYNNCI